MSSSTLYTGCSKYTNVESEKIVPPLSQHNCPAEMQLAIEGEDAL